jgi:hypothetical protein
MRSNSQQTRISRLTSSFVAQAGAGNLKYLLSRWHDNEDTPLSRLQTPLDIFLDSRIGLVSLELSGAPAVQTVAAPSSPPLRR